MRRPYRRLCRPAGLGPQHDGTIDGLRRTMDAAGIDHAMTLGVAVSARTVERTNEFIGAIDRRRFTPFGTVHPDLPIAANLASLSNNGIRGVKLHPLFQDLALADPRVIDLLGGLAEADITVITHAGAGSTDEANERGAPRSLRSVIDAVPNLRSSLATSAATTVSMTRKSWWLAHLFTSRRPGLPGWVTLIRSGSAG
jgi:predicted TIM-barrel fold metal-dependent hydrolase